MASTRSKRRVAPIKTPFATTLPVWDGQYVGLLVRGIPSYRLNAPEFREEAVGDADGACGTYLTPAEARDLAEALTSTADTVEDPTAYVGVEVSPYGRTFSYIDPDGELQIGDRVLVPFGHENVEHFGTVVALGPGSYGSALKKVTASLDVVELTA